MGKIGHIDDADGHTDPEEIDMLEAQAAIAAQPRPQAQQVQLQDQPQVRSQDQSQQPQGQSQGQPQQPHVQPQQPPVDVPSTDSTAGPCSQGAGGMPDADGAQGDGKRRTRGADGDARRTRSAEGEADFHGIDEDDSLDAGNKALIALAFAVVVVAVVYVANSWFHFI